jgi:hypothetical protein
MQKWVVTFHKLIPFESNHGAYKLDSHMSLRVSLDMTKTKIPVSAMNQAPMSSLHLVTLLSSISQLNVSIQLIW